MRGSPLANDGANTGEHLRDHAGQPAQARAAAGEDDGAEAVQGALRPEALADDLQRLAHADLGHLREGEARDLAVRRAERDGDRHALVVADGREVDRGRLDLEPLGHEARPGAERQEDVVGDVVAADREAAAADRHAARVAAPRGGAGAEVDEERAVALLLLRQRDGRRREPREELVGDRRGAALLDGGNEVAEQVVVRVQKQAVGREAPGVALDGLEDAHRPVVEREARGEEPHRDAAVRHGGRLGERLRGGIRVVRGHDAVLAALHVDRCRDGGVPHVALGAEQEDLRDVAPRLAPERRQHVLDALRDLVPLEDGALAHPGALPLRQSKEARGAVGRHVAREGDRAVGSDFEYDDGADVHGGKSPQGLATTRLVGVSRMSKLFIGRAPGWRSTSEAVSRALRIAASSGISSQTKRKARPDVDCTAR